MTKGIYMLAIGHPNYGKMAAALVASMKMVDAEIKTELFYAENALDDLSDEEKALFDHMILLPAKYYTNRDKSFNPIKARLYAYDQTQFDETLCIDVDNIWVSTKTPTQAMDELKDSSFTISNNGHTICGPAMNPKFSPWAKLEDICKEYSLEGKRFYDTSGEWFYFKKDETAKNFFDVAQKIFNSKPGFKVSEFIGQRIPDELAFSIAIAQTELYPHKDFYWPTSWNIKYRNLPVYKLGEHCYCLCMGGSKNIHSLKHNYNIWAQHVYREMGLKNPFNWIEKRNFITERK